MAVPANAQNQANKGNQQNAAQSGQNQSASGSQRSGSNGQQSANSQNSSSQESSSDANQNKSDSHNGSSGPRQQDSSQRNSQQGSGQDSRSGQHDRNRDASNDQTNGRRNQDERRDGDQQRNRNSGNQKYKNASDLGFKFNGRNDGLVIADISNNGPIARFGFHKGDRIVSVNGHRVTREDDLLRYLLVTDVDRVAVIVVRDGREETIYVEPAVFIEEDNYDAVDPLQRFGIVVEERDNRVVVVEVIDDSPAYRAGLRQGDVLLMLGGHEYRTRSDVEKAVREFKSGDAKVQVRRGEQTRDFSVKVSDSNNSRGESRRDQRHGDRNDSNRRGDSASTDSSRNKQSEHREREDKQKDNGSRDQHKDDQSSGNRNADAKEKPTR
jgi:C-terminal processing protease CtpA/Prc